jgi:hypothetical protein
MCFMLGSGGYVPVVMRKAGYCRVPPSGTRTLWMGEYADNTGKSSFLSAHP